jgi:hypothetical protein
LTQQLTSQSNVRCTLPCRALEQLKRYFQGELLKLDDDDDAMEDPYLQQQDGAAAAAAAAGAGDAAAGGDSLLLTEQVKPRQGLPPLMVNISERWVGFRYSCAAVLYPKLWPLSCWLLSCSCAMLWALHLWGVP